MTDQILTNNDFVIGSTGTEMGPMLPMRITSREQAFRTAAWIELMGSVLPRDPGHPEVEYEDVRRAIQST